MANILAQQYPTFQKAMRIIQSISNNNQARIVTTFAHQYQDGLIVRINIPKGYGMTEMNQKTGTIQVIDSVTFDIDINSSLFEPFITPTRYPENRQYPQVVPIAEINSSLSQATQNVLPYINN